MGRATHASCTVAIAAMTALVHLSLLPAFAVSSGIKPIIGMEGSSRSSLFEEQQLTRAAPSEGASLAASSYLLPQAVRRRRTTTAIFPALTNLALLLSVAAIVFLAIRCSRIVQNSLHSSSGGSLSRSLAAEDSVCAAGGDSEASGSSSGESLDIAGAGAAAAGTTRGRRRDHPLTKQAQILTLSDGDKKGMTEEEMKLVDEALKVLLGSREKVESRRRRKEEALKLLKEAEGEAGSLGESTTRHSADIVVQEAVNWLLGTRQKDYIKASQSATQAEEELAGMQFTVPQDRAALIILGESFGGRNISPLGARAVAAARSVLGMNSRKGESPSLTDVDVGRAMQLCLWYQALLGAQEARHRRGGGHRNPDPSVMDLLKKVSVLTEMLGNSGMSTAAEMLAQAQESAQAALWSAFWPGGEPVKAGGDAAKKRRPTLRKAVSLTTPSPPPGPPPRSFSARAVGENPHVGPKNGTRRPVAVPVGGQSIHFSGPAGTGGGTDRRGRPAAEEAKAQTAVPPLPPKRGAKKTEERGKAAGLQEGQGRLPGAAAEGRTIPPPIPPKGAEKPSKQRGKAGEQPSQASSPDTPAASAASAAAADVTDGGMDGTARAEGFVDSGHREAVKLLDATMGSIVDHIDFQTTNLLGLCAGGTSESNLGRADTALRRAGLLLGSARSIRPHQALSTGMKDSFFDAVRRLSDACGAALGLLGDTWRKRMDDHARQLRKKMEELEDMLRGPTPVNPPASDDPLLLKILEVHTGSQAASRHATNAQRVCSAVTEVPQRVSEGLSGLQQQAESAQEAAKQAGDTCAHRWIGWLIQGGHEFDNSPRTRGSTEEWEEGRRKQLGSLLDRADEVGRLLYGVCGSSASVTVLFEVVGQGRDKVTNCGKEDGGGEGEEAQKQQQ
ncbi:hypothetical protein, conserved [Eimeria acervulina]|uniref:Transmembrane protein n=1 Tax=Eimeria acervulina TaxID=5801 RepID=U6GMT1_EIMAC|nr:hypothetical protein, conserved [Eimeria acervulina]CDI79929.1 hypothetical protein, conserved [Eimeria acervulina]